MAVEWFYFGAYLLLAPAAVRDSTEVQHVMRWLALPLLVQIPSGFSLLFHLISHFRKRGKE